MELAQILLSKSCEMVAKNRTPNRTSGRIIVVDSDPQAGKYLVKNLRKQGFRVERIVKTNRLFEKIKNEQVDALILAVEVCDSKGYELIPTIKKINNFLPIIATSTDDSIEVAAKVREQGVFFYAMKPFDMKEIKLALKNALNRKFTHRYGPLTVHKTTVVQKDFEDDILDLAETCRILNLSKQTVSKLAKKGELPATKIGRRWYFIRNQLLEWLRLTAATNQKNYSTFILETMDEGVAVVDRRLRIVSCNSAYLQALDVPRDQIIGEYCYRVSHRSTVPCDISACPVRKAFKIKRPVKFMHINYDSEGNEHYCDVIAIPMKNNEDSVTHVLEVIRDNTENYNLYKNLNRIASFFANESKKTLGPVVMNISALIDEKLSKNIPANKRNEMLLASLCNLKLMQDMIRNYIISYKGEKGEIQCNKKITNLDESVIAPVIKEFQLILLRKKMTIEFDMNRKRSVYCDPDLIKIAFSNLIHNAIKYGTKNTTIKCSLQINNKDFELTVFNLGSGIPRDKLINIFEPFTRYSRYGIRGTGLGLHVVKMIAEMHDGTIEAQSGYVINDRPISYDEFHVSKQQYDIFGKNFKKFAAFSLKIVNDGVQAKEV